MGIQWATKKRKKERAKEGMIIGIRKKLTREREINVETEGIITGVVRPKGQEKLEINRSIRE